MEFNIDKTVLQKELGFVQAVAEKKGSTPVLKNVLLRATAPNKLQITGTDKATTLITEIEADVVTEGSALVIADKLFQLTRQLPAGVVNVQRESNDRVRFTLEEIVCRLSGAPVDSFPEIPKPQVPAIEIDGEVMRTMIEFVIFAKTNEESRFDLSSIKMVVDKSAAMLVGTNGHRLSVIKNTSVTSKEKVAVLVPGKALGELAKLAAAHEGSVGLKADDNHAYFTVGHRTLITALTNGQFPDFRQVLPQDNGNILKINGATLLESVNRVGLLATDQHHRISFRIGDGTLTVSANAGEIGDARERLKAEYTGTPLEVGFNVCYLQDYLAVVGGAELTIKLKDETTQVEFCPALPESYQARYVLCPVRK